MKVKVFVRNVTSSVPGGFENLVSKYFEEEINAWLAQTNAQLVSIQLSSAALSQTSLVVVCMIFYRELSPSPAIKQPAQQNNELPPIER